MSDGPCPGGSTCSAGACWFELETPSAGTRMQLFGGPRGLGTNGCASSCRHSLSTMYCRTRVHHGRIQQRSGNVARSARRSKPMCLVVENPTCRWRTLNW
eukprot:scaffold1407_cov250-Prasinococcus_capsulatus_cf.AAC.2